MGLFKKVRRAVGGTLAGVAGTATLGLVKPKALGVTSKSGKRYFRVGRAVAVVGGLAVAGSMVGAAALKAGAAKAGGLALKGGTLAKAAGGSALLSKMQSFAPAAQEGYGGAQNAFAAESLYPVTEYADSPPPLPAWAIPAGLGVVGLLLFLAVRGNQP